MPSEQFLTTKIKKSKLDTILILRSEIPILKKVFSLKPKLLEKFQ